MPNTTTPHPTIADTTEQLPAHRMFGKDWWSQPLAARYASIDACRAGLMVQVENVKWTQDGDERLCITWRGSAHQFRATKTFPNGVSAKSALGKYVHPDQLRGTVYPDGDDKFIFVIEFCNCHSKAYIARHAREALADEHYLNFRNVVLGAFQGADNSKR